VIKLTESKETAWSELLQDFTKGIEKAINQLEKNDVENIPGAKEALLNRLNNMKIYFPRNDGELFIKSIDDTIQKAFFPYTTNFVDAFNQILNSRTHEQDFIINELLNGFVTSKKKAIATGTQGPIIDRLVEAFRKRSDFHIVDHQFYAMFGDPNKPRKFIKKSLEELANLFGLVSKQIIIEKDIRRHERKSYIHYTFPEGIINILKEKNYLIFNKSVSSIDAPNVIKKAQSIAQNNKHQQIEPIHILITLMEQKEDIVKLIFEKLGVNINQLLYEIKRELNKLPETKSSDEKNYELSNSSERLLDSALEETELLSDEYTSSEHLLVALAKFKLGDIIEEIKFEEDQLAYLSQKLESYGANKDRILQALMNIRGKYLFISKEFDRNIFICMFLANIAINRDNLEKIGGTFTVNGISAIFALILLLGTMPKLNIDKSNLVLKDPSFNSENMSVIPKSWMMKQVLEYLFEPLIKIIAYRLGGGLWLSKIIDSEMNKKIHSQIRFLLKDVNKWVLGNLCRVEVPIFVEISSIFVEITPDTEL